MTEQIQQEPSWADVKAGDWIRVSLRTGAGVLQGVVLTIESQLVGYAFTMEGVSKHSDNWKLREHRPAHATP